ncbi:hypothetical protein H1A28_04490 [Escherichia coli]|nr:hypothetical protein [Escherichia coli]MBA2203792.1 hypothetical protein [Escherichia coli]
MGEWIHRCRQTTTHTFGLPDIGAPVVLNSGYPLSVNKQHRYPPGSQGDRPDDPRQLQNGK